MSDTIANAGGSTLATPASVTETTENTALEATEAEEGGEEGSSEEVVAPKAKEAVKKNLRKLKLKVDGKEFEEEIDLDNDEYLTKQIQLAKASQKRMQEYSDLEKDVRNFMEELRKNPRKVLSDPNIGVDIKQLAVQIIDAEIENEKKSPEQREKEKLMEELAGIKAEREKEKEASKHRELTALQEREFERYDMLMTQALEKHSDLPKSPYVVKKMADYMLLGLQEGLDIVPEDVVELVREEIRNDIKEMFTVLPEDIIEQIVGKEKINGIRKKNLAKAKAASAPKVVDTGKTSESPSAEKGKKISFKDFFGT